MSMISNVILRLTLSATWQQCKRELYDYKDILLSDKAEIWLLDAIKMAQEEKDREGKESIPLGDFPLVLSLLKKCREVGIDRAFQLFEGYDRRFSELGEEKSLKLMNFTTAKRALRDLFEAETVAKQAIIEEQAVFLFSEECDNLLADYLEYALKDKDEDFRSFIQYHQMLIIDSKKLKA